MSVLVILQHKLLRRFLLLNELTIDKKNNKGNNLEEKTRCGIQK